MSITTSLLTVISLLAPPDSLPKRVNVLPFPLLYYTPETRFAYGLAATVTFRFRRDLDSSGGAQKPRPSQFTLGAAYTQNRQMLVYLPFQVFYDHDRYYVNGEAGYYRYNYYFFGLGQREVPPELYGVNFPRIRINAFRRLNPAGKAGKLYGGVRYQYEDYQVTTVAPTGALSSGTIPGGLGSRLSGAGLGLFYDARDQIFFPTRGIVADLAYLSHGRLLGSNVRFDRYSLDVSSYHAMSRRAILAVNYFVSFTSGTAPFNALSLLGGTRRMRGYYEGRYRDLNAALVQTELRLILYRRLGGVLFGSVGLLGDRKQVLRVADPKAAYGAGLRFTINRRDHLNIRLDYGFGRQSSGFYLTIGEAF